MIIVQQNNDFMWKMDQILNRIMGTKYPNDSSVFNDRLRSSLVDCYGFNLNMFDTHQFAFSAYNGSVISDFFYIYEAPMDKIKKICGDSENAYGEYFANNVVGQYPEGTVLGFFATEFKDPELRKQYKREYAEFLYIAMNLLRDKGKTCSAYDWYLNGLNIFYVFKRFHDDGLILDYMGDLGYDSELSIYYGSAIVDICAHVPAVVAIMDHHEEYIKACSCYRFPEVFNFFRKYDAIDGTHYSNGDLVKIGVTKVYQPSDDGFTMQEVRPNHDEDKEGIKDTDDSKTE